MKLNKDQQSAVTHIYENGETYLVGQMGSGKTVVALTAMRELLDEGVVKRVLIVAPKAVLTVWPAECLKWDHLKSTNIKVCQGPVKHRCEIVWGEPQIMAISFDNLAWLGVAISHFDMIIIDEVSKMKAGGVAFKRLRKYLKGFEVKLVMSGTPVSENWEGLFYPMMIVNPVFGNNKSVWLAKYFQEDYSGYSHTLIKPKEIAEAIAPYMYVLPDYVAELPPLDLDTVLLDMDSLSMEAYKRLERDSVVDLPQGQIVADNGAILKGKLQQFASGFLYTDDATIQIHEVKTDWIVDLYRGRTVFVYSFTEELRRLREIYPDGEQYSTESLERFREGKISRLFLHPKSAGHGVDLTCCSNMIFMSPVWSRDLFRQTVARIWRRGQTETCFVRVLCCAGTVDLEMVGREANKASHHDLLMTLISHP
tara:strand:- start:1495 stop:2763 length:1269 start_codon:yes stop_codon:yes gene_type:complete